MKINELYVFCVMPMKINRLDDNGDEARMAYPVIHPPLSFIPNRVIGYCDSKALLNPRGVAMVF